MLYRGNAGLSRIPNTKCQGFESFQKINSVCFKPGKLRLWGTYINSNKNLVGI